MSTEKEQQETAITIALIKQRLDQHDVLFHQLSELKSSVDRLVQKFEGFDPHAVIPDQIHALRLNELEKKNKETDKRIEVIEEKADKATRKLIYYSGCFAVIIFLLMWFLLPLAVSKLSSPGASGQLDTPTPIVMRYDR